MMKRQQELVARKAKTVTTSKAAYSKEMEQTCRQMEETLSTVQSIDYW